MKLIVSIIAILYSYVWTTPSLNSAGSMPCGGGDIGMNVWVEHGDILFYLSRSGTFDANNTLLKQGRIRLRLSPNPFIHAENFRQELKLNDGYVEISVKGVKIQLWADVFKPVVHVELDSRQPVTAELFYENWRYKDRPIRKGEGQQCSYKWAVPEGCVTAKDSVSASGNGLLFFHRNAGQSIFDVAVKQQGLEAVKGQLMNPLANLTFGGKLRSEHLIYIGTRDSIYAGTDYRAWIFRSQKPIHREHITIALHTEQAQTVDIWQRNLAQTLSCIHTDSDRQKSRQWWNAFWQRSFITATGAAEKIARNYTLFRYMLGCNAYGAAPTKFNGGLFTFDPCFVSDDYPFTPDFRKWGGGTMTAQNQRLVYWPMLKSGDTDMMASQFDFYKRMLGNAELRTKTYWGHNGACFTEQIENFGLPNPTEYGFKRPESFDKGMEYNAWLEYEWDTVLEFCQMILDTQGYANANINPYLPLIDSCLTFFDEHYRYLASHRGRKELDGNDHLMIYPGSACETYKITNNAASTIAALQTVLKSYGKKDKMLGTIPPIPLRTMDGKEMIAPAKSWERINNTETPQLYPVFPWRIYGIGREGLETARNTYLYDPDALKFRSHTGWKQDNIWAACLGLTDEAARLAILKLSDGPYRFPAFWGPGFDWSPDHNQGGSGMIGLQEMLMQCVGDSVLLFPAWPKEWDVHFRLHAPNGRVVEAELKGGKTARLLYNFNPAWHFHRGNIAGAESPTFDDSTWETVSLPHTAQLMPAEASGCRNYQGIVWYRKHFTIPAETKGKDVTLYFEAVMGKQTIYLNGKKVKEHLGGYLPFSINLSKAGLQAGDPCLIAVCADNSDDKTYPPGKRQYTLDFAYHGGIYRDVWLIAKSKVAITDPNEANKVAGGGIFVHFDQITERSAKVYVDTDVKNSGKRPQTIAVETTLVTAEGATVGQTSSRLHLQPGESKVAKQEMTVRNPKLWSPDTPYLYKVESRIKDGKETIDGETTRIGIRKAEFRGKEGFWLNGKPFGQLVGTNRHQDFAYVGNAVPNSQQWRDAKKLRDAGCKIIRVAHYPMDPAFMDACDELGLFVIVATPGWQYWNDDPAFAALVHENTRQIIRRDRNHPSVLMWEPILNETHYPEDFALQALQITKDEFPYPGRPAAAADVHSAGVKDHYDVVYGWPGDDEKGVATQCIFTREFGENVDDWYAQNNNNRASRSWGERPMLVQALSLAQSYDGMFHTAGGFIGGAQWHSFDHQRGYHPDPYWGGLCDAFRQPKYAYYLFKSQERRQPMVYIAHEMTAFSDKDVVVFSNCDSVRLSIYDGKKSWTKPVVHAKGHIPNAPVTFENVWDFWEARDYSYKQKKWQIVNIVAEGIIAGKVVCTEKKMPSRRSTLLRLFVDDASRPLVADGSDFVVVIAEVTDDNGNVRRLAKDNIVFTVEGEGSIIGDESIGANPRAVEFGSAPVLIRSTRQAGKIKVKAHVLFEGTMAPGAAEIEFESVPSPYPFCFDEEEEVEGNTSIDLKDKEGSKKVLSEEERNRLLQEVERQQTEFGVEH